MLKMDAMCKDTNTCSLWNLDSQNPYSCEIQQFELFYHVCLIHILGIHWHEEPRYSISQQWLAWLPLESSYFYQVGHRITGEEPKATKNVGMLYSWAARDKGTREEPRKHFKDAPKSSRQACQRDVRTC